MKKKCFNCREEKEDDGMLYCKKCLLGDIKSKSKCPAIQFKGNGWAKHN